MELDRALGIVATVILLWVAYVFATRSDRGQRLLSTDSDPQRRVMNRLVLTLGIGLLGLAGRLTFVSILRSDRISKQTGANDGGEVLSNPRFVARSLETRRGRILDRNGEILADSIVAGGVWRRRFLVPESAHLLGYFSPRRYGTAGIEASRDPELSGSAPLTLGASLIAGFLSTLPVGHDVQTTIDLELQRLATSLLEGTTGSVILIEPHSGRVRAMASSPTYDPNLLTTASDTDITTVDQTWDSLQSIENQPLLLRATSGLYPPGSTFKVLVASAAIDSGTVQPETMYTDDGSLEVDGRIIPEFNRPDDSQDLWSVREGLAYSLNVVFAQVGLELGADRVRDYATAFGIGTSIPFELPVTPGQISSSSKFLDQSVALADTSFGQGELLVTPLHMALAMCAIANSGRVPSPVLVDRIVSGSGTTIRETATGTWKTPIRPESATTMLDLLYDSVSYGYASGGAIPGLLVAGKTGTAESGRPEPHGWFIGSAGVTEPSIVVSVCLDYGGEGGGLALQIGRQLLDAAVSR